MLLQQLKLLGLIALVLAEIGATVAHVNQVVRFRSGLDHNDTLRRMWSKADQVIYQPVTLPGPLALLITLGVFTLLRSLILSLLQIFGLAEPPTPATDFAVSVLAAAPGTLVGAAVYLTDGGSSPWILAAGNLVLLELWVLWDLLLANTHQDVAASMVVLWSVVFAGVIAVASYWASRIFAPRAVAPSSVTPLPWAVILPGSVLLLILRTADVVLFDYIGVDRSMDAVYYLGGVLLQFAGIMVLIGCAFVSILVVNRSIMAGAYYWQWRAFLAPFLLVLYEVAVKTLQVYRGHQGLWFLIGDWVMRSAMYLASGFLGAAVYLGVLALFAHKALNEHTSDELILDDDDDYDFDGAEAEAAQFRV